MPLKTPTFFTHYMFFQKILFVVEIESLLINNFKQLWMAPKLYMHKIDYETLYTGCLSAKGDVLTSWYDSDFRVRVKKNRFLWSWVAEIYAWTTNLDFFDLTQPQQPQIKKVSNI